MEATMSNEAKAIYKFISGLMNWENPEISEFIISEAFRDEPMLKEHLINKLHNEEYDNLNFLLMDIDAHCFQKFVDYVLNKR